MDKMIAYCGLNCFNCEAYNATINNNEALNNLLERKNNE